MRERIGQLRIALQGIVGSECEAAEACADVARARHRVRGEDEHRLPGGERVGDQRGDALAAVVELGARMRGLWGQRLRQRSLELGKDTLEVSPCAVEQAD